MLNCTFLEEDDTILVAHKWLIYSGREGPEHTMDDLEDVIAVLGLKSSVKGTTRLHLALIHVTNRLDDENYIELKTR